MSERERDWFTECASSVCAHVHMCVLVNMRAHLCVVLVRTSVADWFSECVCVCECVCGTCLCVCCQWTLHDGVYILVTLTSKLDLNCNLFDTDCGLFPHWASINGFVL